MFFTVHSSIWSPTHDARANDPGNESSPCSKSLVSSSPMASSTGATANLTSSVDGGPWLDLKRERVVTCGKTMVHPR